jgi:dTDP-4-amino-4,6-dideoxygalactose transaminase
VSAFHLFVVRLLETAGVTRLELFRKIQDAGIGVNVHYIPVHLQPYYGRLGFKQGDFPEAESYYNQAITLPLFVELTEEDQRYVIETLRALLQA